MRAKRLPSVQYDVQLMAEDMASMGWQKADLARRAKTSPMAVTRFLRREFQTARTAKKLATALRHPVERYVVRQEAIAS
jgi:transcriptional regulator with XRE-family HTH domain